MSVYLSYRDGALVATARSGAQHDPLPDLTTLLTNLVQNCDRILLDLSAVTLAPPARVAAFLADVVSHQHDSGSEIIIIVDRLSARRLLRAMAADEVAVVSSVEDVHAGMRGAPHADAPVPVGYERGRRGTEGPSDL